MTVAAKASAIDPLPSPTNTPQYITSCHAAVIHTVSSDPTEMTVSATATTFRIPYRSMSAAANGAVTPYSAAAGPVLVAFRYRLGVRLRRGHPVSLGDPGTPIEWPECHHSLGSGHGPY